MNIIKARLLTKEEYEEFENIPSMMWNTALPFSRGKKMQEEEWWLSSENPEGLYKTKNDKTLIFRAPCAGIINDTRTKAYKVRDIAPVSDNLLVRPVLEIEITDEDDYHTGDSFKTRGFTWTILSPTLAICNTAIGRSRFNQPERLSKKTFFRVVRPTMKYKMRGHYEGIYEMLDKSQFFIEPDPESSRYFLFTHRTNNYGQSLVKDFIENWFQAEPFVIEKVSAVA